MAMFDTEIQQTTGSVNVPQPHAVENDSTANLISQVSNVGLNVADQAQRSAVLGNKAIGLGNVANYTVQLGKIQQAVAQGSMSSTAARSRIRDLRSQVIANNPSMLPQIDSATSSFLSDSGLGADIVKGTDAEQLRSKVITDMAKDGWNITPNMSQDQQDDLITAWQQQKLAQQQLQISSAQIAVTRGKLGITSDKLGIQQKQQSLTTGTITQQADRIALDQKIHQQAANQAIFTGASAWATNFESKMQAIVQRFNQSGKTAADQQSAVDQVNLELAQITANASKAGIGGDQSIIEQAIAPMKALASATTGFITGKVETQGYKDSVDNAMNLAKLSALNAADPQSLKTIGLMATSTNMSTALANVWGDRTATQILGKYSQDPTSGRGGSSADLTVGRDNPDFGSVDNYLNGIKSAITKDNIGTLDPNGQKLLANNVTNMAAGILGANTQAKSPSDYNRIFQFLADPAVNAYVVKNPNVIKAAGFKNVENLLNQQYVKNVETPVREEWQQAISPQGRLSMANSVTTSTPYGSVTVPGFKQTPVDQVVRVDFTGGGIRFTANDPDNTQAVASADRLNTKVAPIMGRLIRASATLEGTNNYRKIWNENYAGWFGVTPSPKPTQTNTSSQAPQTTGPQNTTLSAATPTLMQSLWQVESGGDNNAVNKDSGAISIGQLTPITMKELGITADDLKDPAAAKKYSTRYMNMMLARFDGNVGLALAAYNAGPTKVESLAKEHGYSFADIEPFLKKETQDYVPKVLSGMSGG